MNLGRYSVTKSADRRLRFDKTSILTFRFSIATLAAVIAVPANAGETVVYQYDALGRLVRTQQTGTINNGVVTDIDYDAAGNRTDYDVVGSNGSGSGGGATGGVGGGPGQGGNGGGGGGGETPPSFTISDASAIEGGNLTFTVTKTGTVTNSYSVSFATSNSSAVAGSDYTARSSTLTFTAAQSSHTIVITTIDDSLSEGLEIFHLNLLNPTGGSTITDIQAAGTISDNDPQNNPPNALNDTLFASCGFGVVNALANDTDPDGDALSILSLSGAGGMGADIQGGVIVVETAYTGSFTYTVQDTHGATDTATVSVTNTCGGGGPFE